MRVRAAALAVVLLAIAATAAPAFGGRSCGQAVLDAWAAGTLEANRFPAACYQDALDEMPADMQGYSTAPDDIEAVLHATLMHGRASDSSSAPVHPLLIASGGLLGAAFIATVAVRRLRR